LEHSWLWVLNSSLHLHQKRLELLTHRGVQNLFGLVNYFLGNPFSNQEFRCLICKVVAIVIDDVVLFGGVFMGNIGQELLEDLFRQLGFTHIYFLNWLSIWCFLWVIVAYSSTKVILPSEDD
jgi:hypothetical protein